jgi:inosose dehydratase
MDFAAVVAAVPGDYDGDFMIEEDEPSVESKLESHRIPFDWARQNLPEART